MSIHPPRPSDATLSPPGDRGAAGSPLRVERILRLGGGGLQAGLLVILASFLAVPDGAAWRWWIATILAIAQAALWWTARRDWMRERQTHEAIRDELATDIAVRRLVEDALRERSQSVALLQKVAVAANEASDADQAIQACLEEICAMTGFPVGHAYTVGKDGVLEPTQLWFLDPPEMFGDLRQLTERTHLVAGRGLPGRVLATGRAVWIDDVRRHPDFRHTADHADLGVRAAMAFPVLAGKEVVAVLELFSPARLELDPALLDLMSYVGAQLGRVVERQRAERTLRESEQRYESLAKVSPVGLYRADVEGGCVYVNDRWCEITGYTEDAALGDGWHAAVHPEDRDEVIELWRNYRVGVPAEPREIGHIEMRVGRPDGSVRWVLNQVVAEHDAEGGVMGYVGTVTDITGRREAENERRRLEAQVQHAQKLESLGILAGGIAHDFNNLLVGILGNVGLALADLPAADRRRPLFEEVEQAAQRAAELARQMLAYSGRGTFLVEDVDINELVREMVHLLEASISKKASLELRFAAGLPHVRADATQIRQVVMNLITNASEALGDREGVVSIGTSQVDAEDRAADNLYLGEKLALGAYVAVVVTDTGCGMDAKTQAKLFDPFFTTKSTGRGLGMATLLGIVRGHGGSVGLESAPGRGTTFRILLPVGPAVAMGSGTVVLAEEPAVPTAVERRSASTGRASAWQGEGSILVVDDEDAVRRIASRILRRAGFGVIEAENGRRALELVAESGSEVVAVLLDMTMPYLDGIETFHEMRRRGIQIPVVFSSGYNEQDAIHPLNDDAGPVWFVQKPYRPKDLLDEIRRALSS